MSASTRGATPNSGMLAGFQCPKCNSFEPFEIIESNLILVFDDGFGRDFAPGWDDAAFCRCDACGHEGVVGDFRKEEGGA
jgi:hypothetical protein